MEGHARTWFTPKQKAELWERWKSGQCVAYIATGNGGIAPAPRRRALVALRLEEREEISRGIAAGRSIRRIAQGLERSPSTVSREIRCNGGRSAVPLPSSLMLHGNRGNPGLSEHTPLLLTPSTKDARGLSISGPLKLQRQIFADKCQGRVAFISGGHANLREAS